jgi:hypothetical protein
MSVRFSPNPEFHREIERDGVRAAAHLVAEEADHLAKRSMPRERTGPFEVESDGVEVRVVNTDHGGHLIEWGSVNNPPYAPLRRAVHSVGLRLVED